MMYVLPPHLISFSLRCRLLELRSPISTWRLANPWVIRPPSSSLPPACSAAASLSSCSKTRTRPCRASITIARRLPGSGHSGPYSSAAPQFMLVERSSSSTGSFLRLEETAGRISLRGVRFGPPVSTRDSLTIVPFPLRISTCPPDVPQAAAPRDDGSVRNPPRGPLMFRFRSAATRSMIPYVMRPHRQGFELSSCGKEQTHGLIEADHPGGAASGRRCGTHRRGLPASRKTPGGRGGRAGHPGPA